MLIDFNKIDEKTLNNFKGGKKAMIARMYVDDNNKIMLSRLNSGGSVGLHTHDSSSEIIYILQGKGKVLYDGGYEILEAGSCHYCPQGHEHSLINDGEDELVFFAVVPEHRGN